MAYPRREQDFRSRVGVPALSWKEHARVNHDPIVIFIAPPRVWFRGVKKSPLLFLILLLLLEDGFFGIFYAIFYSIEFMGKWESD